MGKARKKRDRKVFPVGDGASGYSKKVNAEEENTNDESKEELIQKIIRQLQDGETNQSSQTLRLFELKDGIHFYSPARDARVRPTELRRPHLVPRCVLAVVRRRLKVQARPRFRARPQARAARWPSHGVTQASE